MYHQYWYNPLVYVAMAFGPLLRVSATSGDMNGFIFFSQAITSPIYMRLFVNVVKSGRYRYGVKCIKATFSFFWHLELRLFPAFLSSIL